MSINVAIELSGASASIVGACGKLGRVVDEVATSERHHTVRTETPLGASSVSEFDTTRGFTVSASGKSDAGTRGEGDTVRTLIEYLASRDVFAAELKPKDNEEQRAWDRQKIDAKLTILAREFHVQVTAVPGDSQYWHSASQGTAKLQGSVDDAVCLLHDAIDRKKTAASRTMILALDARHASAVAEPQVIAEYIRAHGDPVVLGFAAVIIVGPTAALSATLG